MAKIDDSVKKKVPELRFKGFTDDWKEHKFADFIDVKSGKDYKHLNSGPIPVYGTGGYMLSVDRALSDIDAIGIGRKGTIDKPYLLKAPFWTVDTLFYAVPKQNIDLQFSLSIFKKINWKKFDESTGVPSLSKTVINSVGASVPCYEEQQKIGSFFKQLDKTIALHQRKLDLLKEQKKGYLQKMFPKNGAKVPELRFAGFADDWEERKLIDLATTYIGLVTTMTENYTNKGTLLIRNSDIKEGRFDLSNPIYLEEQFAEENKTRRMRKGDVVTVHTGDIGTSAMINSELDGAIGFATITTRPTKELDSNFLAWYFNSNYHKKYAKRMSTGDGRSNYNMKDFNKNVIPTPQIDEQQKIGAFFKQLDDTIALHQCKLDLLKEQKKGFLQKMFV